MRAVACLEVVNVGRESSSHWRAAASQLVTFASRRAGILVGRQELLIWGTTKPFKLDLQLDPKLHSRPRHPLWVVDKKLFPAGDIPAC
jgi:hypothetical protein